MATAITLKEFLSSKNVDYDNIRHRHTDTAYNSAAAAHVPAGQVCKAVVLQDADGEFLMAVLPAANRLRLEAINRFTGKHYQLATEEQLRGLFPDCETGAVPGMGNAYKMDMLLDDGLLEMSQVYVEAGDHENLIKFDREQFEEIMHDIPHAAISGGEINQPRAGERPNWEI